MSRINPIPRIGTYLFKFYSNIVLPEGLFPVGLPVKILKALLPTSILATCPAHLNLLDLVTLTMLGERTNYEVPHCGTFSTCLTKAYHLIKNILPRKLPGKYCIILY